MAQRHSVSAESRKGRRETRSLWKRYAFGWVTLGLFIAALAGHWWFAWYAYVDEQAVHQRTAEVAGFLIEVGRDTLENWQSEFLQLLWQVAGLAYLLYLGSPQSKEGDDRMEAKIDLILKRLEPEQAEAMLAEIDAAYAGRHTDDPHVKNIR